MRFCDGRCCTGGGHAWLAAEFGRVHNDQHVEHLQWSTRSVFRAFRILAVNASYDEGEEGERGAEERGGSCDRERDDQADGDDKHPERGKTCVPQGKKRGWANNQRCVDAIRQDASAATRKDVRRGQMCWKRREGEGWGGRRGRRRRSLKEDSHVGCRC
jgi:hypothetical protein